MDVRICCDVVLIVPDDERVPNDRAVERDSHRSERSAKNGILAGHGWPGSWECFGVRPVAGLGACFREILGSAHFVHPIIHSRRNANEAPADAAQR